MVDRRESIADPLVSAQALLDGRQAQIWTMMPGILQSYDATKRTCTVQTAIQAQQRSPQGVWTNVSIPVLLDCPVQFPRGGGYGVTFPLVNGDEGMVVFASRCIDAWWQSGGVQPQAEFRMHDLSDGCFVPGIMSVPNVPANTSTSTARFYAEDGSVMFELDKDNHIAHVKAATIFLDGNTVFGGTVSGQEGGGGTVNFGDAEIVSNGKRIDSSHTHGGVEPGGGQTDPVT